MPCPDPICFGCRSPLDACFLRTVCPVAVFTRLAAPRVINLVKSNSELQCSLSLVIGRVIVSDHDALELLGFPASLQTTCL